MLANIFLNSLAVAKMMSFADGSPQYRSRFRDDAYTDRNGEYRMFGFRSGFDNQLLDSRSRDDYYRWDYGRSIDRGERCPYENEKLIRQKRSVEDKKNSTASSSTKERKKRQDGLSYSSYRRRLEDEKRYNDRDSWRRYDDTGYRRRYDDRDNFYRDRFYRDRYYEDDRYGRRNDVYDDWMNWRRRVDDYSQPRTYPCGKEVCNWDAEMECNLGNYGRIEWSREHDGYYPRDKYKDLLDYCGSRCSVKDGGRILEMRDVRPEDKGVYRCYVVGGLEQEFQEVKFYPKFPLSSNDEC